MLEMTQELKLVGTEDREAEEVEAYAKLMEDREPLVEKLMELKKEIDAVKASSPEFEAIKKTIADITALDKEHLEFMAYKRNSVEASHKKVKQGQKIHTGYTDLPLDSGSRMFDTKQ